MADDPKLRVVSSEAQAQTAIPKPEERFSLDRFKSKLDTSGGGVETLLSALPISSIGRAGDFVRLHPDEDNYWTPELCFVNVPVDGQKDRVLHLIDEDVAKRHDLQDKIVRFRLALATKPGNAFFLCRVPSQNLTNIWNKTACDACEQAKTLWTQAVSKKEPNTEGYRFTRALDQDMFAEPKWPAEALATLIERTFKGCMIQTDDHPGLLRLLGAKPVVS